MSLWELKPVVDSFILVGCGKRQRRKVSSVVSSHPNEKFFSRMEKERERERKKKAKGKKRMEKTFLSFDSLAFFFSLCSGLEREERRAEKKDLIE